MLPPVTAFVAMPRLFIQSLLYCLNSFFASKMAEEGLMLAVRRDFFIPNLRFDWANTQMAAEHRLWEEQLEQKRLQCLLAFL